MKIIFSLQTLLPIGLLVLQTYLFVFLTITILRRTKILKSPYAGMEYGEVVLAASLLFGVVFISTADGDSLFQAFKIYQNRGVSVWSDTFIKFSQFFLLILCVIVVFLVLVYLNMKLIRGRNDIPDRGYLSLPVGLLMAAVVIAFSIVFRICANQLAQLVTPQYLNFN